MEPVSNISKPARRCSWTLTHSAGPFCCSNNYAVSIRKSNAHTKMSLDIMMFVVFLWDMATASNIPKPAQKCYYGAQRVLYVDKELALSILQLSHTNGMCSLKAIYSLPNRKT